MNIQIQKTAKIATSGNPKAQTIWIALHGYGQLADYFIRKLECLDPEANFVIAPEGLHRFYLRGTEGKVGASWMTKEERVIDIQDYINYLDTVYEKLDIGNFKNIVLLGFSQGASTAARWMDCGKIQPTHYLHWAGVFPPDLELNLNKNSYSKSENYYIVGKQDPYFNQEHIEKELEGFKTKGIDIQYLSFEGKHDLDDLILKSFDKKLHNI